MPNICGPTLHSFPLDSMDGLGMGQVLAVGRVLFFDSQHGRCRLFVLRPCFRGSLLRSQGPVQKLTISAWCRRQVLVLLESRHEEGRMHRLLAAFHKGKDETSPKCVSVLTDP